MKSLLKISATGPHDLGQEEIAEIFEVTKKTVQRWSSGQDSDMPVAVRYTLHALEAGKLTLDDLARWRRGAAPAVESDAEREAREAAHMEKVCASLVGQVYVDRDGIKRHSDTHEPVLGGNPLSRFGK